MLGADTGSIMREEAGNTKEGRSYGDGGAKLALVPPFKPVKHKLLRKGEGPKSGASTPKGEGHERTVSRAL